MSNQISFNNLLLTKTLNYFFQTSTTAGDKVKERIFKNINTDYKKTTTIDDNFKLFFADSKPDISTMLSKLLTINPNKTDTFEFESYKYLFREDDSLSINIETLPLDIDLLLNKINLFRSSTTPTQKEISKDDFLLYLNKKMKKDSIENEKYILSDFTEYLNLIIK